MRSLSTLGLLCLVLAPAMGAAAPLYRVTDIGNGSPAEPVAINEKSQVLVSARPSYVWTAGTTEAVGIDQDKALDFTDKDRVVGYVFPGDDISTRPAYWLKPGKPARLLSILNHVPDSTYDQATGINKSGQIAGWLYHADGKPGPVMWDGGALVDLKPFVEDHCYLYSPRPKINIAGVVAVTSCNHGYRIDTASMTAILLEGFDTKHAFQCNDCSIAYAINDKSEVAGASRAQYRNKDGAFQIRQEATVWNSGGKPKDIGVLKMEGYPDVESRAFGINNGGQVVGYTSWGAVQRAFLYGPDMKITDLNTLIDPSDPKFGHVTLLYATAINDKGEIIGMLNDDALGSRIFKLTPVQ